MGGDSTVTVHSRFNRVMAIIVWAVAVGLAASAIIGGTTRFLWVYPAAALLALFGWAALWRPYVRVDSAGVALQNVSHRVDVPWAALIDVDTRYALTLHTPGQRFAAWSAPAPGMLSSAFAGRAASRRDARAVGARPRPGDILGTDSGDAATIVRERWRERVEADAVSAGMADQIEVRRRWDAPVVASFAVLAATTLWALSVAG